MDTPALAAEETILMYVGRNEATELLLLEQPTQNLATTNAMMATIIMVMGAHQFEKSKRDGLAQAEMKQVQAFELKSEAMESELMPLETMQTLLTVMGAVALELLNQGGSEGQRYLLYVGKSLSLR